MATVIRMQRTGARNHPAYRVVVTDSRRARDGRFIEKVGYYNPRQVPVLLDIDRERVDYWINQGAKPSESVAALLKRIQRGTVGGLTAPKPAKAPAPAKETAEPAPAATTSGQSAEKSGEASSEG